MKGKGVAAAQKQKSIFKKVIFFQFDFCKIELLLSVLRPNNYLTAKVGQNKIIFFSKCNQNTFFKVHT